MLLVQKATTSPNSFVSQRVVTLAGTFALGLLIGYSIGEANHNAQFVKDQVAPVTAGAQITQGKLDHLQTSVLPQIKAELNCQRTRGDVAIAAANTQTLDDAAQVLQALPDCPPAPAIPSTTGNPPSSNSPK